MPARGAASRKPERPHAMTQALVFSSLLVLHGLSAFSACHALLHKRDSSSALGWVALILLMPPAGILLYWLFGIARVDSHAAKLMRRAARGTAGGAVTLHGEFLASEPWGAVPETDLPDAYRPLTPPGRTITSRNVVGCNEIHPLHNGEEAYPAMLEAIAGATSRVYLSTFIFDNDDVGKRFAKALAEAADRGCDTRLLLDGIGSFHPFARWRRILGPRVRLAYFLPPALFPPNLSINLRTHRKVLVCDGATAFTGGMNVSQHHLTRLERPDRVQDLHFRCVGPIARQLEIAFLLDWNFVTAHAAHTATDPAAPISVPAPARKGRAPLAGEPADLLRPEIAFPACPVSTFDPDPAAQPPAGSSLCRLLMDGPGSPVETIQDLFCAMIASAQHSVRIMSPYFLPPPRLAGALTSAALRGVETCVIVPGENNHRLVDWAMRHQLPQLAEKGVRILYQPPPFAHTKLMLVDDVYTLLGSANLDPRSLSLNFELVMEVFDAGLAAKLSAFYDGVRQRSTEAPAADSFPLPVRLRNAASWIFSPYL